MLSPADLLEISENFSIYDHEWRAYSPTLGEPFLIDGCLVYFDGTLVSVCAYRLGDPAYELTETDVTSLLTQHPEIAAARGVCIWGRFPDINTLCPPQSDAQPRHLVRVRYNDYDPADVESLIDVTAFDYSHEPAAREMYRRVTRSALVVEVVQRPRLLAEHLVLMDEWSTNHAVSPYHAALAAAVATYAADPAVHLVETRLDGQLVGFGVVSVSSERRITFLQNYNRRRPGMPIGDAIYAAVLAFAKERDAAHIHMGYSATPTLRDFKRKWAARLEQPPYREAFFTDDVSLVAALQAGLFPWQVRLFAHASGMLDRPDMLAR